VLNWQVGVEEEREIQKQRESERQRRVKDGGKYFGKQSKSEAWEERSKQIEQEKL